jgi:hypothetical protein
VIGLAIAPSPGPESGYNYQTLSRSAFFFSICIFSRAQGPVCSSIFSLLHSSWRCLVSHGPVALFSLQLLIHRPQLGGAALAGIRYLCYWRGHARLPAWQRMRVRPKNQEFPGTSPFGFRRLFDQMALVCFPLAATRPPAAPARLTPVLQSRWSYFQPPSHGLICTMASRDYNCSLSKQDCGGPPAPYKWFQWL